MGKLIKFFGIIAVLVLIIGAGLAAFVRFYLTDERIRSIVEPQAQKQLGRDVAIGAINLGLLSGITIKDFVVKEVDGTSDFIRAGAFVLEYDLMPLLQKELVISELRLEKPAIHISRDKKGEFNFESLSILEGGDKKEAKEDKPAASQTALPIALTIDRIRIEEARLSVRDAKKEIPDIDVTSNATVKLDFSSGLSTPKYSGKADFIASAQYGDLNPDVRGDLNLDNNKASFDINVKLDEEEAKIEGDITNYLKVPAIKLNVMSKKLNLDKLLAAVATLSPEGEKKGKSPAKKGSAAQPADSIPKGLKAQGQVKIDETLYKKLTVKDFNLRYNLENGILTVKELTAKGAGGLLNTTAEVNLNKPDLSYKGNVELQSVLLSELGSALGVNLQDYIAGALQASLSFDGEGTAWEKISKALSADATYSISEGKLVSSPLTSSIASLTGVSQLDTISFSGFTGKAKLVKGGKVQLDATMDSADLGIETNGRIGLDGSLDMPLTLKLSPALSKKIGAGSQIAKFLADEQGNTILRLKMGGSLTNPRPTLDDQGVKDQIEETVKTKVFDEIGKRLGGDQKGSTTKEGEASPTKPCLDAFKGLFNK